MIVLYGFGSHFGLIDPSPFVLKVDAFLRMNELDYVYKGHFGNLGKAPKKKLPFIRDNEEVVADSSFIFKYLQDKYSLDFDDHLSAQQQSQAHFISQTLEESFYWCSLYFRWVDDAGWPTVKQSFFGGMPLPLKIIVPKVARKGVIKAVYAQGVGRHSQAEVLSIARQHLEHLDALLGEQTYFFGEQACSLDATLYAFLAQSTLATITTPLSRLVAEYPRLVQYCERIHQRYYK